MSVYKRAGSPFYQIEYEFRGERIRFSSKCTNAAAARQKEAEDLHRRSMGEAGIMELTKAPSLKNFLTRQFIPRVESDHVDKPRTVAYYKRGAANIAEILGEIRLDQITDLHVGEYLSAKLKAGLSPSTINCGLRTLRKALKKAVAWHVIKPLGFKVQLAKAETQRERVLTKEEQAAYLAACPEPWRTVAVVLLETGMRPGEALGLTWANVHFATRQIQITEGKTKAARRRLTMSAKANEALRAHYEATGRPAQAAWVFPSPKNGSKSQGTAFAAHNAAVEASGVAPFVPYTMRHTALTELAESGCDVFTLAKIAGHASITITMRYIHPQADAISAAFERRSTHKNPHTIEITIGRKRQTRNKSAA